MYAQLMESPRHPRAITTDKSDKFLLRLPDGMRDRIAEAARANNRTMNAEVVARLQESFADDALRVPGSTAEMKRLLEDVAAIKHQLSVRPVQVVIRPNGAMAIYGAHLDAFSTLLENGIEAEEKHDHHTVAAGDAARALHLLQGDPLMRVTLIHERSGADDFEIPGFLAHQEPAPAPSKKQTRAERYGPKKGRR